MVLRPNLAAAAIGLNMVQPSITVERGGVAHGRIRDAVLYRQRFVHCTAASKHLRAI
jgi:hypothetical protein